MLDYKDIITKHYAMGMSGMAIAKSLNASPSGVNDFLRAFKACKKLGYPLPQGITNYGIAEAVYGKNPGLVGRNLSYEMPDYETVSKALGIAACNSYRVEYHHCETLLETLVALKAQDYSKFQKRLKKICSAALLILDDFLLHTITDEREVKVLFEILEKRCEINLSTIICSQREPASWSSMILNDEVSANAILKRATKHYTVVIKPSTTT